MSETVQDRPILTRDIISQKLQNYFKENFAAADDVEIGEDQSLLQLGIIDSLSLVQVVTYIEKEFKVKVAPKDFFPGNFDTIKKAAENILNYHAKR